MKREFGAVWNLFREVEILGAEVNQLLEEERRASKDQKGPKKRAREQKQREIQNILNTFIQNGNWNERVIPDEGARLITLAQILATDAICSGKSTQCKDYIKGKDGLQQWYYAGDLQSPRGKFQQFLYRRLRWMAPLIGYSPQHETIAPQEPNLSLFPPGSFTLHIPFTLRKPYISKDDTDFYILDNPVKKEWVFKVPYIAPSQWKGALRAAMVRELVAWWKGLEHSDPQAFAHRRFRLTLLFGDEKGEEQGTIKGLTKYLDNLGGEDAAKIFRDKLRAHFRVPEDKPLPHYSGCLHFYPTFFDRIGLEVINPHDRTTGAGKNPIYFECVPAGTRGVLSLLYVPLHFHPSEDTAKADLAAIAEGIHAMLTKYGFGAKTSSGYGVAEVDNIYIVSNIKEDLHNYKIIKQEEE